MADINDELEPETIYALREFRFEHPLSRDKKPVLGELADDDEVRSLLLHAARCARGGDLTLPRTLKALQIIHLVPEAIGEALFDRASTEDRS